MSESNPELLINGAVFRDDVTDCDSDCEPQSDSSSENSTDDDSCTSDESCDCDECRGRDASDDEKTNMFALRWRATVTPSEVQFIFC